MSVLVEKTSRGNSSRVAYPSNGRLKARQVVNGICRSLQPSVVLQKPGYHFFSSGLKLVQQWCDRWSLHRHISIVGLSIQASLCPGHLNRAPLFCYSLLCRLLAPGRLVWAFVRLLWWGLRGFWLPDEVQVGSGWQLFELFSWITLFLRYQVIMVIIRIYSLFLLP